MTFALVTLSILALLFFAGLMYAAKENTRLVDQNEHDEKSVAYLNQLNFQLAQEKATLLNEIHEATKIMKMAKEQVEKMDCENNQLKSALAEKTVMAQHAQEQEKKAAEHAQFNRQHNIKLIAALQIADVSLQKAVDILGQKKKGGFTWGSLNRKLSVVKNDLKNTLDDMHKPFQDNAAVGLTSDCAAPSGRAMAANQVLTAAGVSEKLTDAINQFRPKLVASDEAKAASMQLQ